MPQKVVRYSEAFKREVVSRLESGEVSSMTEASERYGIGGKGTVARWVRRYGKNHLLAKVVRVETPKEVNETKELRKQVRDLKMALADAHMDLLLAESYLKVWCEEKGLDYGTEKKVSLQSRRAGEGRAGRSKGPGGAAL